MHQIMYRECFGEIGLNKILKLTPPLVLVLVLVAQSCPTLATPWTAARQAPLSMGFSRQERWSGLPFPPPGDLPTPENRTRVSCLLHRGWIVYHWATREFHSIVSFLFIRCRSLRKILRGIASPSERFSPLSLSKATQGRFFHCAASQPEEVLGKCWVKGWSGSQMDKAPKHHTGRLSAPPGSAACWGSGSPSGGLRFLSWGEQVGSLVTEVWFRLWGLLPLQECPYISSCF